MMTCPDCSANLDDVPIGTPCPNCGSGRRDAVATPQTVAAVVAIGEPINLRIHRAVHAVTSDTLTLKPVLVAETFETDVHGPTNDAPGTVTLVWNGDDLRAVTVHRPEDAD